MFAPLALGIVMGLAGLLLGRACRMEMLAVGPITAPNESAVYRAEHRVQHKPRLQLALLQSAQSAMSRRRNRVSCSSRHG